MGFVSKTALSSIYSSSMQDEIQKQILGAILLVLRPIARSLLRIGVGYREFSEIAKTAFVETASEDYGLRGRPTNISRVAVMTGLTRKEVRRIRIKKEAEQETVVMKTTPVSQVLHRWYTDDEFLDDSGSPMKLEFDGDGKTFSTLVKKYAGDVPPGAMRTELMRIDAIKVDVGGLLQPKKRVAYNVDLHDRLVGGLAGILYPAALNLAHNMEVGDPKDRWENVAAASKFVRKSDRARLMRIATDRLMEFAEAIDDMYGSYEALYERQQEADDDRAVGVAIFYFEEDKRDSDIFR